MENITRRDMLGMGAALGVAAAGASLVGSVVMAEEAPAEAVATEEAASDLPVFPMVDNEVGRMAITLDELNKMRRELIDCKGDYTCEDGTVIPAVYVKLRALTEGMGLGIGSAENDRCFDFFMLYWSEEEAQAMLEMPLGVAFTAAEFAHVSGRDEAECEQLCYDLSTRGLLMRWRRGGVNHYHHIAFAHGLWEYGLLTQMYQDENVENFLALDTLREWEELAQTEDLPRAHQLVDAYATVFAADHALFNSETPFYYPVPVSKDVVAEGERILPLYDWEDVIERNEIIGLSPCQCRLRWTLSHSKEEYCEHPMDTCLSFGEEAEYYIENGIARQISKEEARAVLQRSVDEGMVVQSAYSKSTEIICSCHGDCCAILGAYVALGDERCGQLNSMPYLSHYDLVVDKDACIRCGACAERCPLFAITMDDEEGPVVNRCCVRCGQCGTVCPVGARKLTHREDGAELPGDMLDDYNVKAAFRFTHGIVHA